MSTSPINKRRPQFRVNTTAVFFIFSSSALPAMHPSILHTSYASSRSRASPYIHKQKNTRMRASSPRVFFCLFMHGSLPSRRLFNNCSNLTRTYCSTTFTVQSEMNSNILVSVLYSLIHLFYKIFCIHLFSSAKVYQICISVIRLIVHLKIL